MPTRQARHRETAHYAIWRDTVAGMMAEPRSSVKYATCFRRSGLVSAVTLNSRPPGASSSARELSRNWTRSPQGYGKRPLIVTGKRGVAAVAGPTFPVAGEPTIALVREGVEVFREAGCDLVIAIGGGSAIDAGKAIAAAAANSGDLLDYLEVIGKGQPLECAPYPFIAVPTTAGTGSEVTRNAVLGSPEHGVKVSLRSPLMLPRVAIVDPDLTLGLPPAITASTGLDALTQLIEPYVSSRANPLTDSLCLDGIRHAVGEPAARVHEMAATTKREPAWLTRACSADSRWPTPGSVSCMVSRRRSAACSTRRMERFAPRCFRPACARISPRCASANRKAARWSGIARSRGF